ncbi:hypothetical protein DPMN_016704 [Dreissena polymorpha]|uniref:Uncharacterized protein n=1 Tax=Dreissena polymorpha TaxID=45954 RepID=A0A9D4NDK3_DREPO|nr:hypothetical protein DPMN_016704 [Dreissena polymorpha]
MYKSETNYLSIYLIIFTECLPNINVLPIMNGHNSALLISADHADVAKEVTISQQIYENFNRLSSKSIQYQVLSNWILKVNVNQYKVNQFNINIKLVSLLEVKQYLVTKATARMASKMANINYVGIEESRKFDSSKTMIENGNINTPVTNRH